MLGEWKTHTAFLGLKIPLDSLNGAVWFTALDLTSDYWQVKMDDTSKPLMAFTVSLLTLYEGDCVF